MLDCAKLACLYPFFPWLDSAVGRDPFGFCFCQMAWTLPVFFFQNNDVMALTSIIVGRHVRLCQIGLPVPFFSVA